MKPITEKNEPDQPEYQKVFNKIKSKSNGAVKWTSSSFYHNASKNS